MKIVLLIMTGIGFTLGVVFGLLLQLPIDTLPADTQGSFSSSLSSSSSSSSDVAAGRSRRSLLHGALESNDVYRHAAREQPPGSTEEEESSPAANTRGQSNALRENAPDNTAAHGGAGSRAKLRKNTGAHGSSNSARSAGGPKVVNLRLGSRSEDSQHSSSSSSSSSSSLGGSKDSAHNSAAGSRRGGGGGGTAPLSREDLVYLTTLVDGVTWSSQLEASCPRPFSPGEVDAWRRDTASLDIVKVEEGCGRMQNRLVTFRDASRACARYRLNTDQIQGEVFSYYLARLLNVSHIPPTLLARVDSLSPRWRSVHLQLSLAQWADSKLVVLTKYIDGMAPSHIPPEFRLEGGDEEDATHKGRGGVSNFHVDASSDNGGGMGYNKNTRREEGQTRTSSSSSSQHAPLPPYFLPRLTPTVSALGSKSRPELCQLLQWSDLIVFDYLTANLDRVINNMFNRQWNDQMMASPAHNLEQRPDGALVFLDNESGLFHGYRLLGKYAGFHRALLGALCVFRPSTAAAVKRLRLSGSVGTELQELFARAEPELHGQLAPLPERNVKVLQQRLDDVYIQIEACRAMYGADNVDGAAAAASAADSDSDSNSNTDHGHR